VKTFLAETEKRYRFMRPVDLSYSIPLLLVLAVTGALALLDVLVPRYVSASHRGALLVGYGVFFAAVCLAGYCFTYKNWKRDNGEILAQIARMRQELE
jgi:hypothetical protein